MVFFWVVTALGAGLGALTLLATLAMSTGAPQQAAGAAIALAFAVIPYVFTRALEGCGTPAWRKAMLKAAENGPAETKPAETKAAA